MEQRNEVHLTDTDNGHTLDTDCWCEPTKMYWYTNQHNITMFVVEHNDETHAHHAHVLREREAGRDWITVTLDSLFR